MYEEIKELLINKLVEIQERILSVLLQLNDEQVNWKANIASNKKRSSIKKPLLTQKYSSITNIGLVHQLFRSKDPEA